MQNSAVPTQADPATPPVQDIDQVATLLRAMMSEGRFDEVIALIVGMISRVRVHNDRLEARLAHVLRMLYGRRSEKINPAQIALALSQLDAPSPQVAAPPAAETTEPTAVPAEDPPAAPPGRKKTKHLGRSPLPAHLPREVHRHRPADEECTCALCGKPKELIGVERSEVLDFRPSSLIVRVEEREKLACRPCEKDVVIAPVVATPIAKGRPGPGLLAQIVVSKFEDHQPLNRQSKIFMREGIRIADSTLGDWTAAAAEMLEPIAQEIARRVLDAFVVQADATGLDVLDRKHAKHIKLGTVWVYVGDARYCAFAYSPDGKGAHVANFLAPRTKGYLQGDGDARLERLCADSHGKLIRVGCAMHARRYFYRAHDAHDLRAAHALKIISSLYDVEKQATADAVDPEERKRRREAQSRPLLAELKTWIDTTHPHVPPSSPLGKATRYALGQWESLQRYLEDGRLSIDNGEPERQIRRIALGRNNWWYAGSDRGARHAAIVWTVLATCALQRVAPWPYLRDVFERLSDRATPVDVSTLLPEAHLARQRAHDDTKSV